MEQALFKIEDYIESAYDNDIFRDMELPKILLDEIGEEKLLKIIKRYCEESEDLVFNEDNKDLPAIYDCDYWEEYEMNKPSDVVDEDEMEVETKFEIDKSQREFDEFLSKFSNEQATQIFFWR